MKVNVDELIWKFATVAVAVKQSGKVVDEYYGEFEVKLALLQSLVGE